MNVIRASLAALVLVSVTYGAADQYEEGGHSGATDHPPDGGTPILPAKTQQVDTRAIRKRAVLEFQRKRRSFHEWPASVVAAPAAWPPATYQIQRPYYIPVFGTPGRMQIYFPPQPILFDDPRKSYLPPRGYLPPATTERPSDTTIFIGNRDNFDDDDRPVWGVNPPEPTRNPLRTTTRQSNVPTRRTRPPGRPTTTVPPLVHRPAENTANNNNNNGRPIALRPNQDLPPIMRPLSTTPAPQTTTTQRSGRQEPSRCVWAIISCCSASSQNVSYNCFEQLGCSGAFWDASPCDSDFARAAIEVAAKYYGK